MYRWEANRPEVAAAPGGFPEPPVRPETRVFQSLTVSAVRTLVSRQADQAGMEPARKEDLVLAVNEVATNSVRHAQGWGAVRVWREADALVCEVADRGGLSGALPALRKSETYQENGYGLWLASRLCERVEARSLRGGTVVRLQMTLR